MPAIGEGAHSRSLEGLRVSTRKKKRGAVKPQRRGGDLSSGPCRHWDQKGGGEYDVGWVVLGVT